MLSSIPLLVEIAKSETRPVDWLKMSSNESPFGPSAKVLEAIARAAVRAQLYPEGGSERLCHRLAQLLGVPPEQILVTAGSAHFLDLTARALLGPGLTAVTSERSFIGYGQATRSAGARLIEAPMRGDTNDVAALLAAIEPSTRLLFLANPNNPTGTCIDAAAIDWLLDRVPPRVTVILDEAYYEFAQHSARNQGREYSRALAPLDRRSNVAVLRTFSKAYGLAGLRVGYGIGPSALIATLAAMRTVYSVSALAESAALAALEDGPALCRTLENNQRGVLHLENGLRALGIPFSPTCANFIFVSVPGAAADLAARLFSRGILVKPLAAWGAPGAIRVTVGTPAQNERFLINLASELQGASFYP